MDIDECTLYIIITNKKQIGINLITLSWLVKQRLYIFGLVHMQKLTKINKNRKEIIIIRKITK